VIRVGTGLQFDPFAKVLVGIGLLPDPFFTIKTESFTDFSMGELKGGGYRPAGFFTNSRDWLASGTIDATSVA